MKVKKTIELLKNENPTAKVYWDGLYEQNGFDSDRLPRK